MKAYDVLYDGGDYEAHVAELNIRPLPYATASNAKGGKSRADWVAVSNSLSAPPPHVVPAKSAWAYFQASQRAVIKASLECTGEPLGFGSLAKAVTKAWKELEDRSEYEDMAKEDR